MISAQIFRQKVWSYYCSHKRDLPWRTPTLTVDKNGYLDLYNVFISEVMLQQTQVTRVLTKFPEFLERFPSFTELAAAQLSDILRAWQGLGYNRRAKYVWESAKQILSQSKNHQWLPAELDALPGIGPATAASIYCFTYNRPIVFIETNIRKAHLFHFFPDRSDVPDGEVAQIVGKTLDKNHPREWYYALMDYGAYLVTVLDHNPNTKSKQYVKQSKFEGSDRQMRGNILKLILSGVTFVPQNAREKRIYKQLVKEGLITV